MSEKEVVMLQGVVKWFSGPKGYGFIAPASAEPVLTGDNSTAKNSTTSKAETDVFVHFSAIEMEGYKFLVPAQPVAYEASHREDGRTLAVRVIVQE